MLGRTVINKWLFIFADEEYKNVAKTELFTPDIFYQINNNDLNNPFLHMNISSVSLSYWWSKYLQKQTLKLLKLCRIKIGRSPNSCSSINMNNYSHEYSLHWVILKRYTAIDID